MVVVFPLVPVTAIIGIVDEEPGGKSMSITGSATFLGSPLVGCKCILNPGAALSSTIPPLFSDNGVVISGATISTPPISRPTIRIARSAIWTFAGWTESVTSIAVPPVERLAVVFNKRISFLARTDFRVYPESAIKRLVW